MTNSKGRTYREDITGRSVQFLRAVGTSMNIRNLLGNAGYTEKDQMEGWNLLCAIVSFRDAAEATNETAEAIAAVEAWGDGVLRRGRAGLKRLHPEHEEVIFGGLDSAAKGMEAVVVAKVVLDRMDSLEASKGAKGTFDTLNQRGVTKAERKRVRGLVETAHTAPKVEVLPVNEDAREEEVKKLHAWLSDWSEVARTVIPRRDYLIRMGVSRPSKKKEKTGTTPVPPAVVVDPAAPALPAIGNTEVFAHAAE